MTTWGVDEEARDDVVGTASARLLAAGVPRADRLGALRLLGLLSSNADEDGTVRRSVDDLAGEFDLPPDDAAAWLAALADVGIVRRRDGVLLLAGVEPPASGGLRLSDFLATAAAMDAAPGDDLAARRRHRLLRPAPALAAAAVVVAALAFAPMIDRQPGDAGETLPVRAERPEDTVTDAAPATTSAPEAPGPAAVAEAPSVRETPPPPPPPTTTTTIALPCRLAEPLVEVERVTAGVVGTSPSIEGTATNGADGDVEILGITVRVRAAGQAIEVQVLGAPLLVPAGTTVPWTTEAPAATAPDAPVTAAVDGWRGAGDAVDGSCR